MNKQIYDSAVFSLVIQFIIAFICLFGLFIHVEKKDAILNEILILETLVQIIEFCFYLWLIYNFSNITFDVTLIRYIDWFITTPTMLFSIIAFMIYRNTRLSNMDNMDNMDNKNITLKNIVNKNTTNLIYVFVANALMLILGFLGELKILNKLFSFFSSSIFLFVSFYIIYSNYVSNDWLNKFIFWFNFVLWSGYGIGYLYSVTTKNVIYNILDIFSKNINGLLILLYILLI